VSQDSHQELVNKIVETADAAIGVLATRPEEAGGIFREIERLVATALWMRVPGSERPERILGNPLALHRAGTSTVGTD